MHIRRAGQLDAKPMAALLNAIIEQGGTTALTQAVTAADLAAKMAAYAGRNAWHLAEDQAGMVLGFQWLAPNPNLPAEALDIATFVQSGSRQLGIGSALFDATCTAARALGCRWINATIRADNSGGLVYYQSRGFQDYGREYNITLADGPRVERVHTRFEL